MSDTAANLWAGFSIIEGEQPMPEGAGHKIVDLDGYPCEIRVASHDAEYAHARLTVEFRSDTPYSGGVVPVVGTLQHGGAGFSRWFFRDIDVGPFIAFSPSVELKSEYQKALTEGLAALREELRP